MRIRQWAILALTVAPFLAGCKDFWKAPVAPVTPTTLSSGNIYVLNAATHEIAGLIVTAGKLTALPGSPYPLSAAPIAITVAPNNAFLYVSTVAGIFVYTINADGGVTVGNKGGVISQDLATSMQVDTTNSWLIEGVSAQPGPTNLSAIQVNPATGVLASLTQQTQIGVLPASTFQIAIAPDNSLVFVAMQTGGTAVIPFTASNANPLGKVSTIGVKNVGGAALSVAVDPGTSTTAAPRLLYIGETVATSGSNSGGLRVFNYSTLPGTVQEITGSPYAIAGLAPYSILPFSTGDFVYVVNRQVSGSDTGVIAGFSISETNNVFALTALGSTFGAGTNPQALVEDNTKGFVFAVNVGGSPDLIGYNIDSTKAGYLDPVISAATGTDPVQASAIAAAH